VALAQDGEILARAEHDLRGGYAESLFGLFDEALGEAGWKKDELEVVAAVQGPGSFTGLRVGLMTAKTLAHARGWRLDLAHASDLLAAQYTGDAPELRTLLPAGRAHAYARDYHRGGDSLLPRGQAERVGDAELADWAAESDAPIVVEASFLDRLDRALPGARPAPDSLVAALARASSGGSWPARAVEVSEAAPLYLGVSQAERVHGVDLTEQIRRPRPPVSWN
jgi:tRNA threonylcarbamoyladenosine biosynthesis protein TsaB